MKFRSYLISRAKESPHPRSHHAALVAKGNQIFGYGVNYSHYHAEEVALAMARNHAKGATLYTLMVKPATGALGNGSPCPECMELIRETKIRRVVVYV